MGEGNRQHLLGSRHFQIQRQVDLGHQPVDVAVGDVAPVFAQMRGSPVSTGLCRDMRRSNRIGMIAPARVPYGRDVIDVDAEPETTGHAAARLPGFIGGIAASSGGRASASYVGTSIRIRPVYGTPRSALPPDRSTIDAAAITFPPACSTAFIAS